MSLLVHPLIASGSQRRWYGSAAPPGGDLDLVSAGTQDGGPVWLRYGVRH